MKLTIVLLFFFILLPYASNCQKINVAVAANAQYPLLEIKEQYEKKSGNKINLTIGSSGKLFNQIDLGAPFDIFISADTLYNSILFKKKLTIGRPSIYGKGTLVFWCQKKISAHSISKILSKEFQTIAIANPKTAPYGIASIEVLKHYNLYNRVKSRIILGESIAQVNTYIQAGSVDFAITSKSSVSYLESKQAGSWIEINPTDYNPIPQSVVLLKTDNELNKQLAVSFFNYLLSKEAKAIFTKYGYK